MAFYGFLWVFFLTLFLLSSATCSVISAIVRTLPGFSAGPLPFKLETGYVSVGEDSELFYFFVESQGNPQKDPLLLYMVGGPYCSALNPFFLTGPLKFNTTDYSDGFPTLSIREDAWTKVASIIYIDQPAGAGFSYTKNPNGPSSSDTKSSKEIYEFMRKWLHDHQDFIDNKFYVVGESYSGFVAPIIAQEIIDGNKIGLEPQVNLVGYILSSPVTDGNLNTNARVNQAYYMGLISKPLYESAKRNCREDYIDVDPSNVDCLKDVDAISECSRGLNYWYVAGPRCEIQPDRPLLKPKNNNLLQLMILQERRRSLFSTKPVFSCDSDMFAYQSETWGNTQIVRGALNVDKGAGRMYRCDYALQSGNYDYDVKSALDYHHNHTKMDLQVLVFGGDLDLVLPRISTEEWVSSLNLDVVDDWRPWIVDDQVAGYTMKYKGKCGYSLAYATVKDSGHAPTEYKSHECYSMFKRWIRQDPL